MTTGLCHAVWWIPEYRIEHHPLGCPVRNTIDYGITIGHVMENANLFIRIVEMIIWRDLFTGIVAAFFGVSLLALGGCAQSNRYDELRAVSLADGAGVRSGEGFSTSSGLAFVFGGGGVRGFAHLGVIKALAEGGISADIVTGSSVGAVAAALYASGMQYPDIEKTVMSVKPSDLTDVIISEKAMVNGRALAEWINDVTGNKNIEELPVLLGVTATDVNRGRSLLIVGGNLGHAVQASTAIPGTCMPVEADGSLWVDGGLLALVPVRYARMMGAKVVVAVDIMCGASLPVKSDREGMLAAALGLLSCKVAESEITEADFLIRPGWESGSLKSFKNREEAVMAGYLAGKLFVDEYLKNSSVR